MQIEDAGNKKETKQRSDSDFLRYTNSEGRKLDFHSIRHTCGAWLVIAGINVKTVQTIMRHSKPELTLNTYGHLMDGAEQDAIQGTFGQFGGQQICSKLVA